MAGGETLPATGYVTYVESKLEPVITITELPVTAPIMASTISSEQRLQTSSPLLDLERGLQKPVDSLSVEKPKPYERRLDTNLDTKLEGPALRQDAGSALLGNAGETSRLSVPEPTPYPTTVGTGTVGLGGTEVPVTTGTTMTGGTTLTTKGKHKSKLATFADNIKEKLSEKKHHHKAHKHHHGEKGEKLSHEDKKHMSNEEKYIMHEQQAAIADQEGKGLKAGIEDLKAGYRKTEAETEVKEGKHKHKHHKSHKKDVNLI